MSLHLNGANIMMKKLQLIFAFLAHTQVGGIQSLPMFNLIHPLSFLAVATKRQAHNGLLHCLAFNCRFHTMYSCYFKAFHNDMKSV